MAIMNTMRLTLTPDLITTLELIKVNEFVGLDYPEIAKAVLSQKAVTYRKPNVKIDYSDPTPEEMMLIAARSIELEEAGEEPEPYWEKLKLKPFKFDK